MRFIKTKINSQNILLTAALIFIQFLYAHAQFFGAGYQTVIKTEYQYTDYMEYNYPEPVLYHYPDVSYDQPQPYIYDFPEHRFLVRATQYLGFKTAVRMRYQYGSLNEDISQNIFNSRVTYELNDQYSVFGGYQHMNQNDALDGTLSRSGDMVEIGGKFNFAGAVHLEPGYQYYTSDYVTSDAKQGGGHNFSFKYRQALTATTAAQLKYNLFYVDFHNSDNKRTIFRANTVTLWLSQYLPTETAVHIGNRFYVNASETESYSPSIEIDQYLAWNKIIRVSYRYYKNRPGDLSALNAINGSSFSSNAMSVIFDYDFTANAKIQVKYRYYWSDQDIRMNTYLFSIQQIL